MNHDVRTKFRPAIKFAFVAVELVGIINPECYMKRAVGIERFDFIETFGHLPVSLNQLGANRAARAKNRVGFEQPKIVFPASHPNLQPFLLFQAGQNDLPAITCPGDAR